MTMPRVTTSVEDLTAKVYSALEFAISEGSLASFLETEANQFVQEKVRERFQEEGPGWAELAPFTVADRESKGFPGSHPILKRTGALEDYIVNNPGTISATPEGAVLVTPNAAPDPELQAKFNMAQFGDKRNGTPARPVIGLTEEDAITLTALLTEDIAVKILGGVL